MRKIALILLIAALAVAVVYPAFSPKRSSGSLGGRGGAAVAYVRIAPVERQSIRQWIGATGDVAAQASVSVFSEVEGELKKLLVDEGDAVTQGQVIAQIDPEELEAAHERYKAALGVMSARAAQINAPPRPEELQKAKTQLDEANVRKQRAEADYTRQKELFQRNISSRELLDAAEMSFAVATAQFNVAKADLDLVEKGAREEERNVLAAQVKEADTQVHLAELRLRKATIKAPIAGIVDKRYFDQGAYVDTDKPIFRIVDIRTVKVLANIPERDVAGTQAGMNVEVEVDAYPGRVFAGEVRRISPTVAADSRTAEIEVAIPNKEMQLKPGMFARVRIIVGEKKDTLVVATDAVVKSPEGTHLFIVKDGKASRRPVKIGLTQDSLTEVLEGVQEQEQVVTFGLLMLKDGMDVVVKGPETTAPAPSEGEKSESRP
ncbi:MAG: efflux RND transporter periplasmic adaptor subunit [Planctomycetota bacterium]